MKTPGQIYDVPLGEALRFVSIPWVLPAIAAGILHGLTLTGLHPHPRPMGNIDETIVSHQAHAALHHPRADILLVGDSSCLMNVDALHLQEALGGDKTVLNLGTLSHLGIAETCDMLEARALNVERPDPVIVTLRHPEGLRGRSPDSRLRDVLHAVLDRSAAPLFGGSPFGDLFAVDRLRVLFLDRWIPSPLPPAYGCSFGFTTDLWRYLDRSQGSLPAPDREGPSFRSTIAYRLHPSVEEESVRWARVSELSERVVGITPFPESYAPPGHDPRTRLMLLRWGAWCRADHLLDELPLTLPDSHFAGRLHLNRLGVQSYTRHLAESLTRFGGPVESGP